MEPRTFQNNEDHDNSIKDLIDKKKFLNRDLEKQQTRNYSKIGSADINYKEQYIYKHYLGYIENYKGRKHYSYYYCRWQEEVIYPCLMLI